MPPTPPSSKPKSRTRSPRLSREDWLRAALGALQRGELDQLKIELLASTLKVTKGSFYWHFDAWADFVQQLLEYWRAEYTSKIPELVDARGGTAGERLLALAEIVEENGAAAFDVAMQAWSLRNQQVATAVAEAEELRLDYVRSLFQEVGFEGEELEMRTQTFVVFASFQAALRKQVSKAERQRQMERRVEMLIRQPEDSGSGRAGLLRRWFRGAAKGEPKHPSA